MDGFFSKKTYEVDTIGKKYSCASCGLYKYCNSPKMEPYGNFKKQILIVAENPDSFDDQQGIPFQGKHGRMIRKHFERQGIDVFEDCLITYATRCHTDKKINWTAINSCRKFVLQLINQREPKMIILIGTTAVQSVIGSIWKKDIGSIHKWHGYTIPDQTHKAWICPIYSPQFVLAGEKEVETVFERDVRNLVQKVNKPVPVTEEPEIEYITDLSPLNKIKSGLVAFDYETTGLKPQAKGHRIVCASVADSENHVWTFEMPVTKKGRKPFTDLLENQLVDKMAHNMKFEDNWTTVRLRTKVQRWAFDSQLAAHIIDNRPDITSLKFQTYVLLGIGDYDSDIAPYLKAASANEFNTVTKLMETEQGKHKLLKYCAYDSVYEYRIAQMMMKKMDYDLLPF